MISADERQKLASNFEHHETTTLFCRMLMIVSLLSSTILIGYNDSIHNDRSIGWSYQRNQPAHNNWTDDDDDEEEDDYEEWDDDDEEEDDYEEWDDDVEEDDYEKWDEEEEEDDYEEWDDEEEDDEHYADDRSTLQLISLADFSGRICDVDNTEFNRMGAKSEAVATTNLCINRNEFGVDQYLNLNDNHTKDIVHLSIKYYEKHILPSIKLRQMAKYACNNFEKDCSLRASSGECDKNPSYMLASCPLACRSCPMN